MGFYPIKPELPFKTQSDVPSQTNAMRMIVEQAWATPALGTKVDIFALTAVDAGGQMIIPPDNLGAVATHLILTIGGTLASIKNVDVIITGTAAGGGGQNEHVAISAGVAAVYTTTDLFKTVTSVEVPAQTGAGVTVKVGIAGNDTKVMGVQTVPTAGQLYVLQAIAAPDYPRALSVSSDGVAGDIKASTVIVYGTNINDVAINDTFLLTVNTKTDVEGVKAFKTITQVLIPAQDGAGVTISVGTNGKLGLDTKLSFDSIVYATLDGTIEAVQPTATVSSTAIESNTVLLASALNGDAVKVGYMV